MEVAMRRKRQLALWAAVLAASLATARAPAGEEEAAKPTLEVYDFASSFDRGRLGRKVAEMLRHHASKSGRYVQYDQLSREEILAELHGKIGGKTTVIGKNQKGRFLAPTWIDGQHALASGGVVIKRRPSLFGNRHTENQQ